MGKRDFFAFNMMVLFLVCLAGMFFFDLFCGGIVRCFSAETRWAPMLGDIRESE
jgi:hypothetical protein